MNKINNNKIILNATFTLGTLAILALGLIMTPTKVSAQASAYITPYGSTSGYNYNQNQTVINTPVSNPKPAISSINPNSSNVGVGTKTITITGTGFVPNSVARINGSNRTTTFIDSTHLLIQVTGNDVYLYRSNGGFYITVFNGAPDGGYSNGAFFTVKNNVTSGTTTTNTQNSNTNNTSSNFTDTNGNQSGNENVDASTNGDNNYSNLASNAIFGSNSLYPSGLIQWVFLAIIVLLIIILVRKVFGQSDTYHAAPMKHE